MPPVPTRRELLGATAATATLAATSSPLRAAAPADAFIDRIGMDVNVQMPPEEAIRFAGRNGMRYIQVMLDLDPEALTAMPDARAEAIRELAAERGVTLSLHSLSAVNNAAVEPFVAPAVDDYLRAYVDTARRIGAKWLVVHGGYHFHAFYEQRRDAAVERIARVADYAGGRGVRLLVENHNREPERAEVHYMPWSIEQCRYYLERLPAETVGWSFNVSHAHLTEAGIRGFLEALPVARIGEVRLADNTGEYEHDLPPGEGTIDFAGLFGALETRGYRGPYLLAFAEPKAMLPYRSRLAKLAP